MEDGIRDGKPAPALHVLHETGGTRGEDRRNDTQANANKQGLRWHGD
jgi:hypothetical protein